MIFTRVGLLAVAGVSLGLGGGLRVASFEPPQPPLKPPADEGAGPSPFASLDVGVDCYELGGSACKSGLCWQHHTPDRSNPHFCTTECRTEGLGGDCPDEWTCVRQFEFADWRVCFAPDGWKSHATARDNGSAQLAREGDPRAQPEP